MWKDVDILTVRVATADILTVTVATADILTVTGAIVLYKYLTNQMLLSQ
jgi:hypothetical protein